MTATLAPAEDVARPALRQLLRQPFVAVVVLIGIALRVWILRSPQGLLNSDEAYTGLQAIDITRGHLTVVIGGAAYTGTTELYALGPLLQLTGQHVIALKLLSPILWALAAVAMVGAARRWVGDRAALLAGALVWLTPGALGILSTRAYVAYALGLGVVTATMWSSAVLVDAMRPRPSQALAFGALAGLAFYTHPMFAAAVAPMAAVVLLRHRGRIRDVWLPSIGASIAVNVPLLVWNIKNDWASLDQPPAADDSTYVDRLRGFFTGLLPRDLGVRRLGSAGDWIVGRPFAALVVLLVLALAAWGATLQLRADRWRGALLATSLVAVWFLMAALDNLSFVDDGRYGIVAFPMLALALAAGLATALRRLPAMLWVAAAAWLAVCSLPFLEQEAGTRFDDPNASTQLLVDAIQEAGFDRVAGDYWIVLPIEYLSHSRIRVAVAGNPYIVRLAKTQRLVDATPADQLAYVFPAGSVDPTWLKLPIERYRQVALAGYVLYLPH